MSQQRQFHVVGTGNSFNGGQLMMNNDTTYTKLFVGGLAWETQRDTMKRYFEQFGEILEAVVITDKSTGRSKGYGFVTFKDPESAFRACQNPSPVIDGRRANCNLACLGAQKNRPSIPQHIVGGPGRYRGGAPSLMSTPPTYAGSSSSTFFPQASPQVSQFSYSPYGYSGYTHDTMYHMNYYGMYGQHLSPYYTTSGGAGVGGYMGNYYPYYTNPYAQMQLQLQSSQTTATATATAPGFGVQFSTPFTYPHHMLQQHQQQQQQQQQQQHYSVAVSLPQQFMSTNTSGLLSLPPSTMALPTPTTSAITPGVTTSVGSGPSKTPTTGAATEQNSST